MIEEDVVLCDECGEREAIHRLLINNGGEEWLCRTCYLLKVGE
jgi:formylmethanofuran dehydrogenase subunit E